MIHVAILPSDLGACGHYRLLAPLGRLEERGEIRVTLRGVTRPDGSLQPALLPRDVDECDVLVVQKAGGADLHDVLKEHGHKAVFEIDDDIATMTRDNPAFAEELARKPGFVGRLKANMRACRVTTVTTDHLAAAIHHDAASVRVVPNGLTVARWRPLDGAPRDRLDERVRIGYLASRNHVEDVRLLYKPFSQIARAFPHVTFVLAGAFYRDLKAKLGDRLEYHAGVDIESYPAFARSLDLDIGVAPLVDSRFARSKSPLKWLEYSALGVPVVASPVEPYARVVESGRTGELAGNANEWTAHLSDLIENPDRREELATAAWADVRSKYTLDHTADAWLDVLRGVVN